MSGPTDRFAQGRIPKVTAGASSAGRASPPVAALQEPAPGEGGGGHEGDDEPFERDDGDHGGVPVLDSARHAIEAAHSIGREGGGMMGAAPGAARRLGPSAFPQRLHRLDDGAGAVIEGVTASTIARARRARVAS